MTRAGRRTTLVISASVLAVLGVIVLAGLHQVSGCPSQEVGGMESCVTYWEWGLPNGPQIRLSGEVREP